METPRRGFIHIVVSSHPHLPSPLTRTRDVHMGLAAMHRIVCPILCVCVVDTGTSMIRVRSAHITYRKENAYANSYATYVVAHVNPTRGFFFVERNTAILRHSYNGRVIPPSFMLPTLCVRRCVHGFFLIRYTKGQRRAMVCRNGDMLPANVRHEERAN